MAVPQYAPKETDASYFKPYRKNPWQSPQSFVYNQKDGTFLGRDAASWAKIGVFYLIFYGVLAALFSICMWVFFQTLDPRIPRWQLNQSIIGTSPGLGFRPMPPADNVESTLIWYKATDELNYKHWTDSLKKFLEVYRKPGLTPGRGENIYSCDYGKPPHKGQVCNVDVKNWEPCTEENRFNYHKSSPCIFIKLNKIYNWVPEFYNKSTGLPAEMPMDLKRYIADLEARNASHMLNTVWVSCEGENPADVEYLGRIEYIPHRGFPGYFYPYENSVGYLSPILAIHLVRPRTGILINIECRAWARNIQHDRHERVGMVHFELMID
ncbi:sodium/potassium-transporting ATPase subunit beta-2 isoform X1 [Bacillus rossius redtenbacheri]|uniref:sodium/potassium-transporting ATPase subunit beta-2 isoform X1 n=1 Tax=Bacillus rossius redtenbacheri TaxID=93214 RepID=UPI002FDE2B6C